MRELNELIITELTESWNKVYITDGVISKDMDLRPFMKEIMESIDYEELIALYDKELSKYNTPEGALYEELRDYISIDSGFLGVAVDCYFENHTADYELFYSKLSNYLVENNESLVEQTTFDIIYQSVMAGFSAVNEEDEY